MPDIENMSITRRGFLGACALLPSISLAGPPNQTASGFVRARGKHLVTPAGEKLILRGINLGNWLEAEGYMFLFEGGPQAPHEIETLVEELIGPDGATTFWQEWRRTYITPEDIQLIKRSGLNSVRIPLHYKFFSSTEDGFRIIDPVIEACRREQLWVILDLHCAPGGQTGTNIDDSLGYPWLYDSPSAQQLTCDIWKRIAQHYKNDSIILGYDLLNEPIPHFPRLRKYNSQLEPLYKKVTAAIREVDTNHVVILGGAQWDSNFKVFGPPFDSNVLYQLHKYWMPPTQASIQEYIDFRERYDVPIWLGESGENNDEWIRNFAAVLDHNEIGWCFWPYKKMEKTSCMVSIPKPAYWDEIVAFAKLPRGTGEAEKRIAARPPQEHIQQSFDDLLKKIPLASCTANKGYFNALGLKIG